MPVPEPDIRFVGSQVRVGEGSKFEFGRESTTFVLSECDDFVVGAYEWPVLGNRHRDGTIHRSDLDEHDEIIQERIRR